MIQKCFPIIYFVLYIAPTRAYPISPLNSGCAVNEKCKRVGDMVIRPRQASKTGLVRHTWPNGEIPYSFHQDLLGQTERVRIIEEAISELNGYLCVNFRPRTDKDTHGITFFDNPKYPRECYSNVGYRPNINDEEYQSVVLGKMCSRPYGTDNNRLTTKGTVMHELIHGLGFFHEQSRDDRDSYVVIHWENISEEDKEMFVTASEVTDFEEPLTYFGIPYNFQSIMHYSPNSRGTPAGSITIEAKPQSGAIGEVSEMGHECYLTQADVDMANTKYKSEESCAKSIPHRSISNLNLTCVL